MSGPSVGEPAEPTGLSSATEPQSLQGLGPTGFDPSRWIIGATYRVPWSPNPHRLEDIRQRHCQLHGEHIGYELYLRKRRNSDVRPWGSISVASPSQEIVLIRDSDGSPKGGDARGSVHDSAGLQGIAQDQALNQDSSNG